MFCYRNALISAFLNCTPLLGWLVNVHQPECTDSDENCLICALATIAPAYWSADTPDKQDAVRDLFEDLFWARVYDPWAKRAGESGANTEQDVDEFLTFLLEAWANQNTPYAYVLSHSSQQALIENSLNYEDLEALFSVGFEKSIKCGNHKCRAEHVIGTDRGKVMKLHLRHLPPKTSTSVDELVTAYFEEETTEDFICGHCKKKSNNTKMKTLLRESPEILTILISRFGQVGKMKGLRKIDSNVEVADTLDLTNYLDPDAIAAGDTAIYDLKAIVAHGGTTKQGHYMAWTEGPGSSWFRINDETVNATAFPGSQTHKTKYMNKPMTPYMLAYVRRHTSVEKPISKKRRSVESTESSSGSKKQRLGPKKMGRGKTPIQPRYSPISLRDQTPVPRDRPLATSQKKLTIKLSLLDDSYSAMESFVTLRQVVDTGPLGEDPRNIGLQVTFELEDEFRTKYTTNVPTEVWLNATD